MSIVRSFRRVGAAVVGAALFATLLSFAAVPDADANHEYGLDYLAPDPFTCADQATFFGIDLTQGSSSFDVGGVTYTRCIYAPSSRITNEAQCIEASGFWLNAAAGSDLELCWSGLGAPLAVFDAGVCPAGWNATVYAGVPSCMVPLRTAHVGNIYKPICIEDPMLQDAEAFADLRVNSEIQADASTAYFVQSGAGCTFDCADGFDANCDGKFGDYCRVEIDRKSVAGAGTCIAEMSDAITVTDVATDAVADDTPTTLAHTGSEESIAMTGLWLLGAGATAMMVRRRSIR